jgi:hypothetical protein
MEDTQVFQVKTGCSLLSSLTGLIGGALVYCLSLFELQTPLFVFMPRLWLAREESLLGRKVRNRTLYPLHSIVVKTTTTSITSIYVVD